MRATSTIHSLFSSGSKSFIRLFNPFSAPGLRKMSTNIILHSIDRSGRTHAARSITDGLLKSNFQNIALAEAYCDFYSSEPSTSSLDESFSCLKEGLGKHLSTPRKDEDGSISLSAIALLGTKIPLLKDFILQKSLDVFTNPETGFLDGFEVPGSDHLHADWIVTTYLELVDLLNTDEETASKLSETFFYSLTNLQGSHSKTISILSSKALGNLIGKFPLTSDLQLNWWKKIQLLLNKDISEFYHVVGFKLWLRWTSRHDLSDSAVFQTIAGAEDYWKYLQRALQEEYKYDCKKYGLHIISRSVQSISENIKIPDLMQWDTNSKEQYLLEWRRYISLVEILGIDASLNQAEASKNDILLILRNKKSLIPSSWGLVLLSVGLKSTMDSIRRFISNLVISMDMTDNVLLADSNFVITSLLNFCTQASHFSTTVLGDTVACPYAIQLSDFIDRLVSSCGDEEALRFTTSVLLYIDEHQRIHDPARIYLSLGLAKGLNGRAVLDLPTVALVEQIATTHFVESTLRENAISYGYLQLLFAVDTSKVEFSQWLTAVSAVTEQNTWAKSTLINDIAKAAKKWDLLPFATMDIQNFRDATLYLDLFFILYGKLPENTDFPLAQMNKIIIENSSRANHPILEHAPFVSSYKGHLSLLEDAVEPADDFYEALKLIQERGIIELDVIQVKGFPTELKQLSWAMQLADLGRRDTDIVLSEYSKIFRDTNILRLGEGRRYKEDGVTAYFNVLSQYEIKTVEEFDILVEEVCFYFPMTKSKARSAMLRCIKQALESSSNDGSFNEVLIPEVHGWWKVLIEERLSARERDLHHQFLEIAFPPRNFAFKNSVALEPLAHSVVKQSYGRRALLPKLGELLYPHTKVDWVKYVFVAIYTLQRCKVAAYEIEDTIGETLDKALGRSVGTSYAEEWGGPEISARALAISHIANLNEGNATELFDYFLSGADYKPFQVLKRNNAEEKRIKIAILQLMLVVERHIPSDILERALDKFFWPSLDPESSLAARLYIEWVIGRFIARDPNSGVLEKKAFEPLREFDGVPRVIVSLERIILLVINSETNEDFYSKLVTRYLSLLIPLATSNKAGVRHSSVAMMHSLRVELDKPAMVHHKELISAYIPILDGIVRTVTNHDSDNKFRKGTDTMWNLTDDLNLVNISGHVLVRVLDECPVIPIRRKDFLLALKPFEPSGIENGLPIGSDSGYVWAPPAKVGLDVMKHDSEVNALSQHLQTKSGAWIASSIDDDYDRRVNIRRGHMIILASLVNKAPNLGGICRLSDILGAELLCLNELSVCEKFDFKSVAMTADQWMPMAEVKEEDIISFMRAKKLEGYSLVGLEQTDGSVQLNSELKFPEKCILLLGKEREGIPGDLLAELDFCIEIKQVGVVRSLNVQTATAIVVHEYSSQHC